MEQQYSFLDLAMTAGGGYNAIVTPKPAAKAKVSQPPASSTIALQILGRTIRTQLRLAAVGELDNYNASERQRWITYRELYDMLLMRYTRWEIELSLTTLVWPTVLITFPDVARVISTPEATDAFRRMASMMIRGVADEHVRNGASQFDLALLQLDTAIDNTAHESKVA